MKKQPIDELKTEEFVYLCGTTHAYLEKHGSNGIIAAFAVGSALASDAGYSEDDFKLLFEFAQKTFADGAGTSKSNVIDITRLLNRRKI